MDHRGRALVFAAACLALIGVWVAASALAGFPVSPHTLPLLVVLMVGLVVFAALQLSLPGRRIGTANLPPSSCPAIRRAILALVGDEAFVSWFNALEFDSTDGHVMRLSVPVTFLKTHIDRHYAHATLQACRTVFPELHTVDIVVRRVPSRDV